jgi:hypothetical protein
MNTGSSEQSGTVSLKSKNQVFMGSGLLAARGRDVDQRDARP